MDDLDVALAVARMLDEDDATIDRLMDAMAPLGCDTDHLYAA